MPRKRRVQKPQTESMEAGAAYGQKSQNLTAQTPAKGGIPLPATRQVPVGGGPQPNTVTSPDGTVGAVSGPPPQALDQARAYQPNVTSLLAPDDQPNVPITAGLQGHQQSPEVVALRMRNQRTISLLERFGAAIGDPKMAALAQRLKVTHRGSGR